MKTVNTALLLLIISFIAGCTVSPLKERTAHVSLPYEEISQSRLYSAVNELSKNHDELSGVYPLEAALDAFIARVLLVRAAEKTLDVQYYIWRQDNTGTLLLYELYLAAERGIRVRLLLDDLGSYDLDDDWLAMLNNHPNIEVRLFNPFSSRKVRFFDFVTHFNRSNRRMHNKSFTADQAMTIVGGRNIGDEYFAATDGVLFADLDVLTVGPAATAVSTDFDRYWLSQSAYPVEQLFKQKKDSTVLLKEVSNVFKHPEALMYVMALQDTEFSSQFNSHRLPFEWTSVRLVSDDPIKGLGIKKNSDLLVYHLDVLLDEPIKKLDLVSPYFVPAKVGTKVFTGLAKEGAEVRVLTNALVATDVAAVHSGYMKRRKTLLKSGVDIYEMKNQPGIGKESDAGSGVFGSSGSSLHAKTFAINNEKIFVGSFNFDPRSTRLNTELGFLIDSPELATALDKVFAERISETAYQVKLDNKGKLFWEEQGEPTIIYHKEPGATWFQRATVRFMSWLPIDGLL